MLQEILSSFPRATDLHATEGMPLLVREAGELKKTEKASDPFLSFLRSLLPEEKKKELIRKGACDFSFSDANIRCRLHLYRAGNKTAAALRFLPSVSALPPDTDEEWLRFVSGLRAGLVLVTGSSGSGKSTTLARMVSLINKTRACHVITIEDPAEYEFSSEKALIHQREIGTDVPSFAEGVRSALREDPDVLVIGEMRDAETISAALTAAETGHLVLATLHNKSAPDAIGRVVHAFPGEKENEIRNLLASVLRTIGAQTLFRTGNKTFLLREILTNIPAVSHLIREGKDAQLNAYMEMGTHHMRTMKQAADRIGWEEKLSYEEKETLKKFLREI